MNKEGEHINLELIKSLSPYMTQHIQQFGKYHLDLADCSIQLEILELEPFSFIEKCKEYRS